MAAPTVTSLMNTLTNSMPPTLLKGWPSICRFTQRARPTLHRYRVRENFPVATWGKNVFSDERAIVAWLMAREQRRRERKRSAKP